MRRLLRILGQAIVSSAIASKVAAAIGIPAQPYFPEDIWQNVRREIEAEQNQPRLPERYSAPLSESIGRVADLRTSVRLSYLAVPQNLWPTLDHYWRQRIGNSQTVEEMAVFETTRSAILDTSNLSKNALVENWIQKVHHKPGHYDNGGGNG